MIDSMGSCARGRTGPSRAWLAGEAHAGGHGRVPRARSGDGIRASAARAMPWNHSSRLSPVSARSFLVFMGVVALIALLAFGLSSKGEVRLQVGETFPDAELPLLEGAGTGKVADYRGKWVFVNVWASWCEPCRRNRRRSRPSTTSTRRTPSRSSGSTAATFPATRASSSTSSGSPIRSFTTGPASGPTNSA